VLFGSFWGPVVNANAPTQSMQNLSTIWQEHKVKSGESLSAIFSSNDLNKLDLHNIVKTAVF
jgi:cell envelope opacity-associated protein A